jgi:fructokinase
MPRFMPHWPFMEIFGAIEAGGTKFICGVGTGPDDIITTEIPTTSPAETIAKSVAWLSENSRGRLRAAGIGSFGPVDLNLNSPTWGFITSTPKATWRNCDLAGAIGKALGVPVQFETDVNAAILGEARWGAAREVSNCLYLTIGTGIGGGAIVSGRLLHGLSHPEMGHVWVPHDLASDPFAGACPYHGDCLEGLASGPAIEARWGVKGEELDAGHPAWPLEAKYLAYGLANYVCTLSPERILIGGGVMRQSQLYTMVRLELARILAGYIRDVPAIVPPKLGGRAGVVGALALAIAG